MKSYWNEKKSCKFESLQNDINTDVCIIGGGLSGLTIGYYLSKKSNKDITIIEKDEICGHTSGHTTGKVTSQHGLFYKYLIDSKGVDFAKKYLAANEEAIDNIEKIAIEENIDCDFKRESAYVFTTEQKEVEKIKEEVVATRSIGKQSEFLENINLPINIFGAIKFNNQAFFHPVKYADGLCRAVINSNGKIYENTKAVEVKKDDDKFIVYTNNGKITADYVVIATRYPIINVPGYYFLKMYQSTSYAIIVDTNAKLEHGMYISSETPTISFRTIQDENKVLLQVVGYDFKTGEKVISNGYKELEQLIKSMYPNSNVLYKWTSEDCITLDKIPYIGRFSNMMENIYVATGYNKWGMTLSNIAGNIISDEILGRENKYEDIFKSTRLEPIKNRKELGNMIKQASNSIVFNKFKVPEEKLREIDKCVGKIIEIDGEKVGVYKDENGKIFQVNPVCTHLGCELSFNQEDKTWDCPCHGSKFTVEGKSIEPPSIKNLGE